MQIHFTFAKRPQIEELFLRMYAVDLDTSSKLQELDLDMDDPQSEKGVNGHAGGMNGHATRSLKESQSLAMDELKSIAAEFAQKLPDEQFPPADIQGFLLLHKKQPRKALEMVEAWRAEELAKRAEKEQADEDDE